MRIAIAVLIAFLIICLGCAHALPYDNQQLQPAAPQYDTGYPHGIWPNGIANDNAVQYAKFNSTVAGNFVFQKDFDRSQIPSLFIDGMNQQSGKTAYGVANGGTIVFVVNITFNCDQQVDHLGAYVEVWGRSSSLIGQPGTAPGVKWFSFTLPQNYITYPKLLQDAGAKTADFLNNGWH